jgi:hypothetical protein
MSFPYLGKLGQEKLVREKGGTVQLSNNLPKNEQKTLEEKLGNMGYER